MASGISVDFSVTNQRATPAIYADTLANRPAAGYIGRLFVDTDIPSTGIYRDTGSSWESITGGSAANTLQQVTTAGNTTTVNTIFQNHVTVGGNTSLTRTHLYVRDAGSYTGTQFTTALFDRDRTYSGNVTNSAAHGALDSSDAWNLAANVIVANATSAAGGINSQVQIRPAGFNLTVTQGAGLRAMSAYRSNLFIQQTLGASSTISDFAHFWASSIFKTDSNPVTITNNYGLAISDQTEQATALTIVNRFGIYQFSTAARNVLGSRLAIGTGVDAGFMLDVAGTFRAQNQTTIAPPGNTTALTVSGYSLTGASDLPVVDITGIWNTTGVPSLIRANVTNTASGANSRVIDLLVNGTTVFSVTASGNGRTSSTMFARQFDADNIGTGTVQVFTTSAAFNRNSGTNTYTGLNLSGTINQTGTATGITRGVFVNPTLTAAVDWRSIEWTNNTGRGLWGTGTAVNALAGPTTIGAAAAPNASALLDLTSTTRTLILTRMTGAQAELIAGVDGMITYITNGNGAVITSTGFWGRDAGAWVKLN